jgi:hypothetical protein
MQKNANRNAGLSLPSKRHIVVIIFNQCPHYLDTYILRLVFMGRSFQSVRQGVNEIADRWARASKKYRNGKRVVEISKKYSSEGFMGCNDPLESVLFSAAVELRKSSQNQDH